MPDMLIRDISVELKRRIERVAREADISLSEAAKNLIKSGLAGSGKNRRIGTEMFALLAPEDRSDDLIFEAPDMPSRPPDFS